MRVRKLIEMRRRLRQRFREKVTLKPGEIAVTSKDEAFLKRAMEVVEEHLDDEGFGVVLFGRKVGMSRTQLHRKLKALTNRSANEFIQSIRMQRAAELLNKQAGTIAEIAYRVGFHDPNYFTKVFRKHFGKPPSEFVNGDQ